MNSCAGNRPPFLHIFREIVQYVLNIAPLRDYRVTIGRHAQRCRLHIQQQILAPPPQIRRHGGPKPMLTNSICALPSVGVSSVAIIDF